MSLKRMKSGSKKGELTEKQLLERVRVQDARALGVLYDRFRPKVYAYALKISGSAEVAEDLVHDVFLNVWQQQQWEEVANLDAFFRLATRNLTLKWLRKCMLESTVERESPRDLWY